MEANLIMNAEAVSTSFSPSLAIKHGKTIVG